MPLCVDLGGRRIIKKIFFKQKTAYEILRRDWSSDVCSSDLNSLVFVFSFPQAFREYYPSSNDPSIILECVWVKDKFVLHERTKASCQKTQDDDHRSCSPDSSIKYETLGPVSEGWDTLSSHIHDM